MSHLESEMFQELSQGLPRRNFCNRITSTSFSRRPRIRGDFPKHIFNAQICKISGLHSIPSNNPEVARHLLNALPFPWPSATRAASARCPGVPGHAEIQLMKPCRGDHLQRALPSKLRRVWLCWGSHHSAWFYCRWKWSHLGLYWDRNTGTGVCINSVGSRNAIGEIQQG